MAAKSGREFLVIVISSNYIPSRDNNPHAIHNTKLIPIEPVLTSKPDGETNIPEPERTRFATMRPEEIVSSSSSSSKSLTYHCPDN